jgi:hypothetical protein
MDLTYFYLFSIPNLYLWPLRCLIYSDVFEFLRFCACGSRLNEDLRTRKVRHAIYKHFCYLTLGPKVVVEVEEARVKGCNEVPAKLLIL